MRCQKWTKYGVDRSAQCPRTAKWKVIGYAGTVTLYCGIHARGWRAKDPTHVSPIGAQQRGAGGE